MSVLASTAMANSAIGPMNGFKTVWQGREDAGVELPARNACTQAKQGSHRGIACVVLPENTQLGEVQFSVIRRAREQGCLAFQANT